MLKSEDIRAILADSFFIDSLNTGENYMIQNDDSVAQFAVMIGGDGDLWVNMMPDPEKPYNSLRFRTFAGGGRNKRTRNALMILAEAIRLDKEEPLL